MGPHLPLNTVERISDELAQRVGGDAGPFGELFARLREEHPDVPLSIAWLGQRHARKVTLLERLVFHAVSITRRVDRQRIFGSRPSEADITAFRQQFGEELQVFVRPLLGAVRQRKPVEDRYRVEDLIDWLYASRHLKNTEHLRNGLHSFL